jgi:hypothetical protein
VVAYCYTTRGRDSGGAAKIARMAMVEGPETIQCKPAYPLTGVIEAPLWEWMDLLAKPPVDGATLGRALTDEDRKALEEAAAQGAEETVKRKAQEGAQEEEDPDAPVVDLSAGQEAPKEEKPKGSTSGTGRVRRGPRGAGT